MCCRHVDKALGHEDRCRTPDTAIRPGRRFRCRNTLHLAAIVRDAVGAWQETDNLNRLQRRRPWIDRIRTDIAGHLPLEGDQRSIIGKTQLGLDGLVETLAGRAQILAAVADPFHRTRKLAGQRADGDFFRIQRSLAAKPTTDIRRDDPDPVAGQVQQSGQDVTNDAGNLR